MNQSTPIPATTTTPGEELAQALQNLLSSLTTTELAARDFAKAHERTAHDEGPRMFIETKAELQEFLKSRGFYGGDIDEDIGNGTIRGLKAWADALDYREPGKFGAQVQIDDIGGIPIYRRNSSVFFTSEATINGDGSPHCYHPDGSPPGLDYLSNAGRPGNWWGIATHNGEGDGRPIIQGEDDPAPGFYVSTTAFQNPQYRRTDPRRYLDSETINFIVIPGGVKWAQLGQKAVVINKRNGLKAEAIVGDIGPRKHVGEISIALAFELRIPSNPKNGGQGGDVLYEIFS